MHEHKLKSLGAAITVALDECEGKSIDVIDAKSLAPKKSIDLKENKKVKAKVNPAKPKNKKLKPPRLTVEPLAGAPKDVTGLMERLRNPPKL